MSFKGSAELQLLFAGRVQGLRDGTQQAMSELDCHDDRERHAYDLLLIARDSLARASSMLWGSAPEIEQRIEITGSVGPIEMPFKLLP